MLPASELLRARADINAALPDTCDVLEVTRTPDGQGGWTEVWTAAVTGVACRLSYRTGVEARAGAALQAYSGWVLTLPYGTPVTPASRVKVNEVTYAVISADGGKSDGLCVRCTLEAL